MIIYQTLDTTNVGIIHQTFVEAFSDYQVAMDLPLWKFELMLLRRGYHATLSVGAFEKGELVGFCLTGIRNWNGEETAYDIATGAIPTYRRQGITSEIFETVKRLLHNKRVVRYLLEVIDTNIAAVTLYKKLGFVKQREFLCFQLFKTDYLLNEKWEVEKTNRIDFNSVENFWDIKPSWQNSVDSITAVIDTLVCLVVKHKDRIIGYGIIDVLTGDIAQLAVDTEYRRQGVARSIISNMIKHTKSDVLIIKNIDIDNKSIVETLLTMGYTKYLGQYEMALVL